MSFECWASNEDVYYRNECRGLWVEFLGHSPGDEPLTLTRCYSCGLSQLYEALGDGGSSVAKRAI